MIKKGDIIFMESEKQTFSFEWAGRPLVVEIGQLAKQANGSCLIRYGESAVLGYSNRFKRSESR